MMYMRVGIHMPLCTDQPKLRSLSHDFVGARNAGSSLACPIYQGSISCHMAYWSSHVCVCVCVCVCTGAYGKKQRVTFVWGSFLSPQSVWGAYGSLYLNVRLTGPLAHAVFLCL